MRNWRRQLLPLTFSINGVDKGKKNLVSPGVSGGLASYGRFHVNGRWEYRAILGFTKISQVILGAQKSRSVLVTYCSLHLHVFPLKLNDNFLLMSAEILKPWRNFRENFCLLIFLPYKICSIDAYSIKLGDLIYILVIQVVRFLGSWPESYKRFRSLFKTTKNWNIVKLFSIVSKLRQAFNVNDSWQSLSALLPKWNDYPNLVPRT